MQIPSAEERPLLTVDEFQQFWPSGRSSLYQAIERGDVPVIRSGRRVYVVTAGVRRLLGLDPQ